MIGRLSLVVAVWVASSASFAALAKVEVRLADGDKSLQVSQQGRWKTVLTTSQLKPPALQQEGPHYVQGVDALLIRPQVAPDGRTILFGVGGGGDLALPWIGGVMVDGQGLMFYPFSAKFGEWEWSPSGRFLALHAWLGESGMVELVVVDWESKQIIGTMNKRGGHGSHDACRSIEWIRVKEWNEKNRTISLESGHGASGTKPDCRWQASFSGTLTAHAVVAKP